MTVFGLIDYVGTSKPQRFVRQSALLKVTMNVAKFVMTQPITTVACIACNEDQFSENSSI